MWVWLIEKCEGTRTPRLHMVSPTQVFMLETSFKHYMQNLLQVNFELATQHCYRTILRFVLLLIKIYIYIYL